MLEIVVSERCLNRERCDYMTTTSSKCTLSLDDGENEAVVTYEKGSFIIKRASRSARFMVSVPLLLNDVDLNTLHSLVDEIQGNPDYAPARDHDEEKSDYHWTSNTDIVINGVHYVLQNRENALARLKEIMRYELVRDMLNESVSRASWDSKLLDGDFETIIRRMMILVDLMEDGEEISILDLANRACAGELSSHEYGYLEAQLSQRCKKEGTKIEKPKRSLADERSFYERPFVVRKKGRPTKR